MKILFFDCETTGKPKNYKAPVTDLDNWPRVVQLAYSFLDSNMIKGENWRPLNGFGTISNIIKPDGWVIPDEVIAIHGITNEIANAEGFDIDTVLCTFSQYLEAADLIVAHNISFDRKIIGAELIRAGYEDYFHGKPRICTMHASTKFCNLPGKYGPKWPKLEELYSILFGESITGAHDAATDVQAVRDCFFELHTREIISNTMIGEAMNYKPKQPTETF